MDGLPVEMTGGPFAGLPAVLLSHSGDRVRVQVTIFGQVTRIDLRADEVRVAGASTSQGPGAAEPTHAALRAEIVREHERLVAAQEFAFFLERASAPETDLAGEWDAYLRHREEVRAGARQRERAALDRFEAELAPLPPDQAAQAVDADAAFWRPGTAASREQRARFPEPAAHTPEERVLAAIFRDPLAEPETSPGEQARQRRDRARLAGEERDEERWRAGLTPDELRAQPARGNPGRYAYARAPRPDAAGPPEHTAGVARTPSGSGSARPAPLPPDADREIVEAIVRKSVDGGCRSGPTTVVGLLLADGAGDVPFPANPWGIPPGADLRQALTTVWQPVAAHAPRFVRAVRDRTLGLALLGDEQDGAALAYVIRRGTYGGPGRDGDEPSAVLGSAPHIADPTEVVPRLAGPVPRPVRDFWAVHHLLDNGMERIGGGLDCNALEFFADDGWSVVAARLDGLPPDRFVHSAGGANYDTYLFDLDTLDSAGNPTVAHWAFKERQLGGQRPYWEWFEDTGHDLIFGR